MGIELHPKFLSLTEPRRYQPLRKSIVAKCCNARGGPSRRKTHGFRNATSFSTGGHCCGMKRLSPLPVHRVFRHAPYLCALPRNRSLLPASSTTLFAIHSHDSQLQGACSRVPRFAAKPRSISTPPPSHYSTCITARVRRNRGRLLSSRCIESATTNVLVRGLAPSRFRYDPKT
jgi:hypothetical protein